MAVYCRHHPKYTKPLTGKNAELYSNHLTLRIKSNEVPVAQNYNSVTCHSTKTYSSKCSVPHRPATHSPVQFSVYIQHFFMDTNDRFLHLT